MTGRPRGPFRGPQTRQDRILGKASHHESWFSSLWPPVPGNPFRRPSPTCLTLGRGFSASGMLLLPSEQKHQLTPSPLAGEQLKPTVAQALAGTHPPPCSFLQIKLQSGSNHKAGQFGTFPCSRASPKRSRQPCTLPTGSQKPPNYTAVPPLHTICLPRSSTQHSREGHA